MYTADWQGTNHYELSKDGEWIWSLDDLILEFRDAKENHLCELSALKLLGEMMDAYCEKMNKTGG